MNFTEISMTSGRTFQSPIYPNLTHAFSFTVTAKNPRAEDFATLRAYVENAATQHMEDIVHDEQLDRDGGAVLELLRSAEAADPRDEDRISELKQSLDTFPRRRLPWVEITSPPPATILPKAGENSTPDTPETESSDKCVFCADSRKGNCGDQHTDDAGIRFICTRPKAHFGPHVACGVDQHNLEQWPVSKNQ